MDVASWNTLLDCVWGTNRAAVAPDSYEVALLATSDPASEISTTTDIDGVPTVNGYERPTISADDWLAAAEAVKTSSYAPDFGTPTEAWETVRFFALIDPVTDAVWPVCPITVSAGTNEPLTVTGAGDPVTVLLAIAAGGVFEG
jgi:hypothetical protein